MFSTPSLKLKTMVVSFSFLGKKPQLYVFDSIFRAEDDDRDSSLFILKKKASALCFLQHFSQR